jgi:hypothetical protein
VDVIAELQKSDVPVLWALKSTKPTADRSSKLAEGGGGKPIKNRGSFSIIDLLKYLTLQAFRLNKALGTERTMAWRCAQFQRATTAREWFDLFQTVIDSFRGELYLVVDLETVDAALRAHDGFDVISAMVHACEGSSEGSSATRLKVLVAMYHTASTGAITNDISQAIVQVKITGQNQQHSKEMRRGVNTRVLRGVNKSDRGAKRRRIPTR